jgi:hypothetical protein
LVEPHTVGSYYALLFGFHRAHALKRGIRILGGECGANAWAIRGILKKHQLDHLAQDMLDKPSLIHLCH